VQYKSLRDILLLLPSNGTIARLPNTLDTLKRRLYGHLPQVPLRRSLTEIRDYWKRNVTGTFRNAYPPYYESPPPSLVKFTCYFRPPFNRSPLLILSPSFYSNLLASFECHVFHGETKWGTARQQVGYSRPRCSDSSECTCPIQALRALHMVGDAFTRSGLTFASLYNNGLALGKQARLVALYYYLRVFLTIKILEFVSNLSELKLLQIFIIFIT
jgi:hypothetical protein